MDENGFDPYECICSHEMAMRRLLSLLRQSQTYCTDNECLNELPGSDVNTSEQNMFFMFCWFFLAVILYFLPSAALRRRENNMKFRDNENDSSGDPSAPPQLR